MNIKILTIVIVLVNSLIIGSSLGITTEQMDKQAIAKVLPDDFASYQRQLKGDNGLNDARACLLLASKAKTLPGKTAENAKQEEDYNFAYCASWRQCLRAMQNNKEKAVQELILEQWNELLKEDDEAVPYQIYANAGPWANTSLVTDDFWKLLEKTNRKTTISAICFMLYGFANQENGNRYIERLMQKQKSGIDIELQGIIQNTINWIKYNLSSNKATDPGPAALGPTLDFKSKLGEANTPKSPKEIAGMGMRGLPYAIEMFKNGDYRLSQTVRNVLLKKQFELNELPKGYKGSDEDYAKLILKWWPNGKKDTQDKFTKYYGQYVELKKQKNESKANEELNSIRNLGVAALPFLIEKIQNGDTDLIPMVVQFTTRRELPLNATQAQVLAWWEKDKQNWLVPFPD
jgi:hypothetical protein